MQKPETDSLRNDYHILTIAVNDILTFLTTYEQSNYCKIFVIYWLLTLPRSSFVGGVAGSGELSPPSRTTINSSSLCFSDELAEDSDRVALVNSLSIPIRFAWPDYVGYLALPKTFAIVCFPPPDVVSVYAAQHFELPRPYPNDGNVLY
uniref:Uncharacterized protein n=1 Tax=Glossina palpalis gambiensis TaxID=67801 RepID=A0A1B0API3_9MUSC